MLLYLKARLCNFFRPPSREKLQSRVRKIKMRAMVLEKIRHPLVLKDVPIPTLKRGEVLIKVDSCGVCRTDLHIIDGELPHPQLPLILGHQIVGTIAKVEETDSKFPLGLRVGVPWLGGCCGTCEFCVSKRENLCDAAVFTGYLNNGGYAEFCAANQKFILPLPGIEDYDDFKMAPLLCAGLIGYRALKLAEPAKIMGFYGFGSSAHLLIQVAQALNKKIFVFTRPGDFRTQQFATNLGAIWVGGSDQQPPELLDAAIIFAPVGALYPQALKAVKKGGKVISAGIHMSDIPAFPYALLWGERSMSSVANLTRKDGLEYMRLISEVPLKVSVTSFPLEDANKALASIRNGSIEGSAVLKI